MRGPSRLQRSDTTVGVKLSPKPILRPSQGQRGRSRARTGTGIMRSGRKSQPKIVITKKDSMELIEMIEHEDRDLRERLFGVDGDSLPGSEKTESVMDTRSITTVESMKTSADLIHFPQPNEILVEAFQDLLVVFAQVYDSVSSISPLGDPVASRSMAYLSDACFNFDCCLRYLLIVNSEEQSDPEKGTDDKLEHGLMAKTRLLGNLGCIAEKIVIASRKKMKVNEGYKEELCALVGFSLSKSDGGSAKNVENLSQSFEKLGHMSAQFANALYEHSGLFTVCGSSIPLCVTALKDLELAPVEDLAQIDQRLPRSSFIQFARDGQESFASALKCHQTLQNFWNNQKNLKTRYSLEFNTFEKSLLALERAGLTFLSSQVDRFVLFEDEKLLRSDGRFCLTYFWEFYKVDPVAAISPHLALKLSERTAFHRGFNDGIDIDFEALDKCNDRQKDILAFEVTQRKRRGRGGKRAFARKLRSLKL